MHIQRTNRATWAELPRPVIQPGPVLVSLTPRRLPPLPLQKKKRRPPLSFAASLFNPTRRNRPTPLAAAAGQGMGTAEWGGAPLLPAHRRRPPLPPRLRLDRQTTACDPALFQPLARYVPTPTPACSINHPVTPASLLPFSSARLSRCRCARVWLPRRTHATCLTKCVV